MRLLIRHFFYFLFWLCVICLERTIGLPFIALTISQIYLSSLPVGQKILGWVIGSYFLAVVYGLPFTSTLLIMAGLLFLVEQPIRFLVRESGSIWLGIMVAVGIIAWQIHFQWSGWLIAYHLGVGVGILLLIRYAFSKKATTRSLRLSRAVKKPK